MLLSLTSITSRILLVDEILWINKASLALYTRIHHAACSMPYTTGDFKLGSASYTALSSSSPVIGTSKPVTIEVESRSQTPSL